MRTIAVINRKGGSGKTTTAVNTAAAIAEIRSPVLLIDLDPQGSASEWLGRRGDEWGMGEALQRSFDLTRLATPTDVPGLEIIAATEWLVTAERSIQGQLSLGISRAIRRLPRRWTCVIIDCPPSLSYLTIGVLMGVRELIIPIEAHAMALSGAGAIMAELPSIKGLNPDLEGGPYAPLPREPDRPCSNSGGSHRDRVPVDDHQDEDPRVDPSPRGRRRPTADHPVRTHEHRKRRLPRVRARTARPGCRGADGRPDAARGSGA